MKHFYTCLLATLALSANASLNLHAPGMTASRADAPEPISEQPEGTFQLMQRDADAFRPYGGGYAYDAPANGTLLKAVLQGDSAVYFCNWITFDSPENPMWIKGVIQGDSLAVFEFPQVGYREVVQGQNIDYNLYVMNPSASEDGWTPAVTKSQTVKFRYTDGVFTQIGNDVIALGGDDGQGGVGFYGYGEYNSVIAPIVGEPATAPDDLEYYDWCLVNEEGGGVYKVAMQGKNVYIKGLSTSLPEMVAHGTISEGNNTISIPSNQFFGADWATRTAVYLMGTTRVGEYDKDYREWVYEYTFTPDYVVNFDIDAMKVWNNDSTQALLVNGGSLTPSPINSYANFTLSYNKNYGKPVQPATPLIDDYYVYDEETAEYVGGKMYLSLMIPVTDINGNLIDTDKLYYQFLTAPDDPYTFDADSYPTEYDVFSTTITDIPFNFTSPQPKDNPYAEPIFQLKPGNRHTMVLPFEVEHPGVRTVYKVDDQTVYSNSYFWGQGEIGIANVITDTQAQPEYYDLMGRRVNPAQHGIFIKRTGNMTTKIVK